MYVGLPNVFARCLVPTGDGRGSMSGIPLEHHRGRAWRIAGFLLVSLALGLGFSLEQQKEQPGSAVFWLAGLAWSSLAGGVACSKRGKKLRLIGAQALMAQDGRSPVLYLRSFVDDAKEARILPNPLIGFFGLLFVFAEAVFGALSEEEQLADAVDEIGPLVAIGKPGEKLPELGAARLYVSDSEWRERVDQLMARAQLVILLAGTTEGFWWELKRTADQGAPEKLVLLFPFGKGRYRKFCERAERLLPHKLPEFPGGWRFRSRLRAILYFGPDWTPHIARLKVGFSINPLVPTLRKALQPIIEQLHISTKQGSKPVRGYLSKAMATIPGMLVGMFGMGFLFSLLVLSFLRMGNPPQKPFSPLLIESSSQPKSALTEAQGRFIEQSKAIPGLEQIFNSAELKSMSSEEQNKRSSAMVQEFSRVHLRSGLRRLGDSALLTKLDVDRKLFALAAPDVCAALSHGTIAPEQMDALLGQLDRAEIDQYFDLLIQAIRADAEGTPAERSADHEAVSRSFEGIASGLPEPDAAKLRQTMSSYSVASDEEVCWSERVLRTGIAGLPKQDQVLWALSIYQ